MKLRSGMKGGRAKENSICVAIFGQNYGIQVHVSKLVLVYRIKAWDLEASTQKRQLVGRIFLGGWGGWGSTGR